MRVLYYIQTHFLDTALPRIRALSRLVELHVLLEVGWNSWRSSIFEQGEQERRPGLIDADLLFKSSRSRLQLYWNHAASFKAIVDDSVSVHPRAWLSGRVASREIRACRPDILHLDDTSLRLGYALQGRRAVPKVLTINDAQLHEGEGNWRTAVGRWLVEREAHHVVLHSQDQRSKFLSKHRNAGQTTSVIPLGVLDGYKQWQASTRQSSRPTVLFFGRLSNYKGLTTLFEAAEIVALQLPDVRFVVAGRPVPGYVVPELPNLPGTATLDVLPEYISNSQLAELFQNADVVVCPYHEATQSGVVLTAYAFKKPVIVTNVGGLPEYVIDGRTGFVVPPRDAKSLAERIVTAFDRLRQEPQIFARGIEELEEGSLSWERIAAEHVETYRKVVNTSVGRRVNQ